MHRGRCGSTYRRSSTIRTASFEARAWLISALCFVAFGLLGAYVSSRTPTRIDLAAAALRGEATSLAAFFTMLGRWYAILAVAAAGVGVAAFFRANPLAVGLLLLSQTAGQAAIGFFKALFHRTRPEHWLLYRETDLSYPSGHAATTIVFYLSLLILALRTPELPRPLALGVAGILGACVLGIPWSRLALEAHYPTDVLGGLLFGAGWLFASLALLHRFGAIR